MKAMRVVRRVKRLAGIRALAEYIDSTPGSIRQQMYKGTLPFPYMKVGRKVIFDLDRIDAWIESLDEFGPLELPEI